MYFTKNGKAITVEDNSGGEFILADLNFDSKQDLALINAAGNRGANYSFFIQKENGRFELDHFLTDTMRYFPTKIDVKNRTLATLIHANVKEQGENVYKFYGKTKEYKMLIHRYIPY